MVGLQMSTAITFPQSRGQRINHRPLFLVHNGSVAAEYPDERLIPIPVAEKATVLAGGCWGKDRLACGPVTAPARQHSDKHPELFCLVHDEVYMSEIRLIWS